MKTGLHNLIKTTRPKRRRGRGLAKGGAKSGRGMKGQKSRAGYSRRAGFEGGQTPLYQRLPKKRGAGRSFPKNTDRTIINLSDLNQFKDNDIVGLSALRQNGFISKKTTSVKLVASGKLKTKITLRVHAASAAAIKAVEKAKGKVEIIRSNKS